MQLVVFAPSQRLEPTTGTLFQLGGGLAEGVHNDIVAGFVLVFGESFSPLSELNYFQGRRASLALYPSRTQRETPPLHALKIPNFGGAGRFDT